jgi:hypothetical protein
VAGFSGDLRKFVMRRIEAEEERKMNEDRAKGLRRVQFELPAEKLEALEAMRDEMGLKSKVDLLEAALTYFLWAYRERKAGRKVVSWDGGQNVYELYWPVFDWTDTLHTQPH